MMNPDIPIEFRRLYNTPFCSLLIFWLVKGYETKRKTVGMPTTLIFIGYTLIINPKIQEILTKARQIKLVSSLDEYPEIALNISGRMNSFCSFFLDGLLFSISNGTVSFTDERNLHAALNDIEIADSNEEIRKFKKVAIAIGKELGCFYDTETIYSVLGVRP